MVTIPASIETAPTPETGVLFYSEGALPPLQVNELNVAEITQLSLDYAADPYAFTNVVRFRNKYIDEIEALEMSLHSYALSRGHHEYEEASFNRLHEWAHDPDDVIRIALRAAGRLVLEKHDELNKELQTFLEFGEFFSREMVDYIYQRLSEDSPLRINGVVYKSWRGVLTKTKREGRQERVTLFAHNGTFTDFLRQNYRNANGEANTLKIGDRYAKIALVDDWQELIDGLNLTARF